MSATKKKACEKVVATIRQKLAQSDSNYVDAILLLKKLEIGGDWRFASGGDRGFDDFIQSNFPGKIPPTLYRKAVSAIELYGEDFIRKIGVFSSSHLTVEKLSKSSRSRSRVKKLLLEYVKKHKVSPTPSVVKKTIRTAYPDSFPNRRRSSAELLRENERLKAENDVLRAEKQKLEAEITLLKAEISDLKASKKPRRRSRDAHAPC